jgi:hypothetical protein
MRHFLRFAPMLLWMAVIVYWSGQSDLPIDHPPIATLFGGMQHRLAHIGAFAILAALVRFGFGRTPLASLWSWLLVVGFAVTDEWHQGFTAGRQVGLDDVVVDSAAGFVSLLVVRALHLLPHGPPDEKGWRSPVIARTAFAALLVFAIAPASGPGLHLAGHVGRRVVNAADHALSKSAVLIERVHRHLGPG